MDGVKVRQLVFADDARQVTYTPPRGWTYSGSGTHFSLQPANSSDAQAEINVVNPAKPQVFDEPTMRRLCDEVIAAVPKAATQVSVVSQEKSPVMIETKETFLVVINYNYYGAPYARSVMFLNRKTDQVRFQLTAPRWSFAQLQKAFLTSHFSWQNL